MERLTIDVQFEGGPFNGVHMRVRKFPHEEFAFFSKREEQVLVYKRIEDSRVFEFDPNDTMIRSKLYDDLFPSRVDYGAAVVEVDFTGGFYDAGI